MLNIRYFSFIENHYQEFINSYVNINFPNLRFIKKLNKIVESVSVENVVFSFYATNFLECPTLIRGIAFLFYDYKNLVMIQNLEFLMLCVTD